MDFESGLCFRRVADAEEGVEEGVRRRREEEVDEERAEKERNRGRD